MRFKGLTSVLEVKTSGYVLKAESELPAATQPTYPLHHRASARMRNDRVKNWRHRGSSARRSSGDARHPF